MGTHYKVKEMRVINDRLNIMNIEVQKIVITCIQIYAPTINAEDEEVEKFYDELENIIENSQRKHLIIMGDFNSQVGLRQKGEKTILGKYGYGNRNERGWRLVRFYQEHNLKIINSMYKKRKGKRRSWIV